VLKSKRVLKLVESLKKNSDFIHILGGPEISLKRIASLPAPDLADYYAIGEGERVLVHLLQYLRLKYENKWTKTDSSLLSGKGAGRECCGAILKTELPKRVAYWDGSKIVYAEDAEKITDLDEIPSVYLTGTLDDRLYARQQAFLETQRGCKLRCRYCVYHKDLPSISYYSLKRIFDELDHLILKKQVRALRIFDAIFTSDLPRAKKIVQHLRELKENGILLSWIYWEFTYNLVDEEFIRLVSSLKNRVRILNSSDISPLDRPQHYSELLKDYTAINCIGIQSFHRQSLKAVGRPGLNIEKFKAFMKMAREYNIALKIDLILGLPFETFDSYFTGLEFFLPFFKDTDHILNIHRLQILPGSDLEVLCDRYGIKYSRQAPHLVSSTSCLSRQEFNHTSRLTAILFRILNSPLRGDFFDAKERIGASFYCLTESIFNAINSSGGFTETQLVQGDLVDDVYWNNEIYKEIPSEWLLAFLRNTFKGNKHAGTRC
jgi:radical SAM superfamily enzyme YgiQ (UPF0313 family)